MLTFDIFPHSRVVGEILPQGHDLLWRHRVQLYMEVPSEWPVPDEFRDQVKDGRIKLYGKFRTFRGKLIRTDRYKAWSQIDYFYSSMQELYWKTLFAKGIILAVYSHVIDEYALVCSEFHPLPVRMLVPKSLPHRIPEKREMENSLLLDLLKKTTSSTIQPNRCRWMTTMTSQSALQTTTVCPRKSSLTTLNPHAKQLPIFCVRASDFAQKMRTFVRR